MKNCTTPRTLAECQFMTGYRGARIEPRRSLRTYLLDAAIVAVFAGWGVLLAWRG